LSLNLIREADFREAVPEAACSAFLDYRLKHYADKVGNDVYGDLVGNLFGPNQRRKMIFNIIVSHLIGSVTLVEDAGFTEPLLRFNAAMQPGPARFLAALKDLVWDKVIRCPQVQQMEFKGQTMVVQAFEAFATDPKAYLPGDAYARFVEAGEDMRVLCDYIAGMTDGHLMKTYERLFSPRIGSVFDKL